VCAGAILLGREVTSPPQRSFGVLDVSVRRNGYGRQVDSFHARIGDDEVPFIRAPLITRAGPSVDVLASENGAPVWVRQARSMATTFHPELLAAAPSLFHRYFLQLITA
jgi:5'-phosphate synthase pdxT subunit